jgi:hypothetical protein
MVVVVVVHVCAVNSVCRLKLGGGGGGGMCVCVCVGAVLCSVLCF